MAGVEEIKKMIQEIGLQQQEMIKGLRDVGNKIRVEMRNPKNEIKEEVRKMDERMVEERKIVERMNELKEKMKMIEEKEREETGGKKETEKGKKVENRITAIERKLERKEREERRRNIIIKGVNCNEKEKEKVVERILARIGERVELESISMIIGRNDMIIMKTA
ncbi:hypothetical protein K0M31_016059 [Melipona bicolor]|uniref:Uncharacterized protein n=1 Tax=Melipona bicolor TaxID=60889 RepID=A0AA40G6F1_9HYME|nr:hypothetical protein K0M31_016059 [Melipona bicolor]